MSTAKHTAKQTAKPALRSTPKSGSRSTSQKPVVPMKMVDPLYIIFEQHLFNFADPDSDRSTFIQAVVTDYLTYLRKKDILVPKPLEAAIVDELGTQVNTMLVKKIYGCLSVTEFLAGVPPVLRRKAKVRYKKIATPKV